MGHVGLTFTNPPVGGPIASQCREPWRETLAALMILIHLNLLTHHVRDTRTKPALSCSDTHFSTVDLTLVTLNLSALYTAQHIHYRTHVSGGL